MPTEALFLPLFLSVGVVFPWWLTAWLFTINIPRGTWLWLEIRTPFGDWDLVVPPWDVDPGGWLRTLLDGIAEGLGWSFDPVWENINNLKAWVDAFTWPTFPTWAELLTWANDNIIRPLTLDLGIVRIRVGDVEDAITSFPGRLESLRDTLVNWWNNDRERVVGELHNTINGKFGELASEWNKWGPVIGEANKLLKDPWGYWYNTYTAKLGENIISLSPELYGFWKWYVGAYHLLNELVTNPQDFLLMRLQDIFNLRAFTVRKLLETWLDDLWTGRLGQ